MFPKTLLTTLLLALTVAANPIVVDKSPISLSLSRSINATGIYNVLRHDVSRAKALARRAGSTASVHTASADDIIDTAGDSLAVEYLASVGVGSPATKYNLVIDTGSSNTWVGNSKAYKKTSTSQKTSNSVSVGYGTGSFSGTEYIDQVTIADGLVIPQQSIGVASATKAFTSNENGILGLGPAGLTRGTLSPATTKLIPTVVDNLFQSGAISSNVFSVYFQPSTAKEELNGVITWGGVDQQLFTGSINYTPITSDSLSGRFWGIDQSIAYGSSTILSTTAGIVDTGTTLILIATDAFQLYQSATGGTLDRKTGLLVFSSRQFSNLQSLFFKTGGHSYELTPNAQIWPRALNTVIGGTSGNIYSIIGDNGTPSGSGLDFINGMAFLQRYYSVYDAAQGRVGFATTAFTTSTTN